MPLTISGCSTQQELWEKIGQAPKPKRCHGITKKDKRCRFMAQGGLQFCRKHWPADTPYPNPEFTFSEAVGDFVFHEGAYVHMVEAMAMFLVGGELPLGLRIEKVIPGEGYQPGNLRLVP